MTEHIRQANKRMTQHRENLHRATGEDAASKVPATPDSTPSFSEEMNLFFRDATTPDFERQLEAYLDSVSPTVCDVKGFWVVAHRMTFKPIKGRVTIWQRTREIAFADLSPIHDSLKAAEKKRPVLWGFFIPQETETDFEAEIKEEVTRTFITSVSDYCLSIAK